MLIVAVPVSAPTARRKSVEKQKRVGPRLGHRRSASRGRGDNKQIAQMAPRQPAASRRIPRSRQCRNQTKPLEKRWHQPRQQSVARLVTNSRRGFARSAGQPQHKGEVWPADSEFCHEKRSIKRECGISSTGRRRPSRTSSRHGRRRLDHERFRTVCGSRGNPDRRADDPTVEIVTHERRRHWRPVKARRAGLTS